MGIIAMACVQLSACPTQRGSQALVLAASTERRAVLSSSHCMTARGDKCEQPPLLCVSGGEPGKPGALAASPGWHLCCEAVACNGPWGISQEAASRPPWPSGMTTESVRPRAPQQPTARPATSTCRTCLECADISKPRVLCQQVVQVRGPRARVAEDDEWRSVERLGSNRSSVDQPTTQA
jgi:hypothetical protein